MTSKLQQLEQTWEDALTASTNSMNASSLSFGEWWDSEEGAALDFAEGEARKVLEAAQRASQVQFQAHVPTRELAEELVSRLDGLLLSGTYSVRKTRNSDTFTVSLEGLILNEWTEGHEEEVQS